MFLSSGRRRKALIRRNAASPRCRLPIPIKNPFSLRPSLSFGLPGKTLCLLSGGGEEGGGGGGGKVSESDD